MSWDDRWASWTDEDLTRAIYDNNEKRYERYARTILLNLRPTNTLDLGGGTGGLGAFLPGKYTVMDHPRMRKFCTGAPWVPIGPITEHYDLVVSTNALHEMSMDTIREYIRQIEAQGCDYLYLNGRRYRYGQKFEDFPLENWEPIVNRPWGGRGARFIEWLGKLKQ